MKILVCYLVAPGENYRQKAHDFAVSYHEHRAGLDHNLLVVLKDNAVLPLGEWTRHATHRRSIWHSNEGHDIRSLQLVMQNATSYDYVMWLGSTTRILAQDWLVKFCQAAQVYAVGAVAATGSYERGLSTIDHNPHLRTSALMMSPKLFNSLEFPPASTRVDAYEFEHGRDSLYRRLGRRGLGGVVVGADGRVYGEFEWPRSDTYRHGTQSNLLIADGQTDAFAAADPREREVLARMAGWEP